MRFVLASMLALCTGSVALAQAPGERPAPPAPQVATPPVVPAVPLETDAREVRQQLQELLSKYPPEVGRILKMDPTMLTNQQYLAQYPAIHQFLATHPEIARNPSFYLQFVQMASDWTVPVDPRSRSIEVFNNTIEFVSVFFIVVFVSAVVAWLVKTLLNHRRWLRVSKVQTDVHNKLLERFAGTNELLAYVQSPAGRRFLEAAPIPVEVPSERPVAAPVTRILWAMQAGIVLVIGGLGFQYVSGRLIEEVSQGLWTIGVLATTFGLGFIAAGAFSYVMSRRLGLLDPPLSLSNSERGDTPGV